MTKLIFDCDPGVDDDGEGLFFEPPPSYRPKVDIPRDPELRRTRPKDPLGKKKKNKRK